MQSPWWKQLLIGLALFLAGYFMFGGKMPSNEESKPEAKPSSSISLPAVSA